MQNNQINFKQERDFGDLFNATFSFITQEFKRLATVILYFVVPFLLLSSIASVIYSVKAQDFSQSLALAGKSDSFAVFGMMGSLSGYLAAVGALSLIASTMLTCTVYGYIKLYIQKGSEGFTINDVWMQVTLNFWRFLGASIVIGLVCCVGLIFCIIPGIYLGIALSIVLCIMIFEDIRFSDAFSRSMKLVNSNWWLAFGVFIIALILIYILSVFVSIPSMILGFKSLFTNMKAGKMPMTADLSISFYVVNAITKLFTQIFTVILIVITAFLYFSYVEKVEKPSLMDKINQIQNNE